MIHAVKCTLILHVFLCDYDPQKIIYFDDYTIFVYERNENHLRKQGYTDTTVAEIAVMKTRHNKC